METILVKFMNNAQNGAVSFLHNLSMDLWVPEEA
jgi:hypothetical protein